jgi:uncharacterized membrane protein YkoI
MGELLVSLLGCVQAIPPRLTPASRRLSASCQVERGIVAFMNRIKRLVASMMCLAITIGIPSSFADDRKEQREQDAIREALQRGEVLPLVRILAIAQGAVPGDVIEVELERKHGALVYEIKILTASGRVREIKVDARTGSVLEIEDD